MEKLIDFSLLSIGLANVLYENEIKVLERELEVKE